LPDALAVVRVGLQQREEPVVAAYPQRIHNVGESNLKPRRVL
jgi:hypothetical protein